MNSVLQGNERTFPQKGGKVFGDALSPFRQMACNHWVIQVSCGYPHHPAARLRRLFCVCPGTLKQNSTESMTVNREEARTALATLLEVFAGPNYSGALRDGDLSTRLERCVGWVKAEASEAASLIEACVPHGKPMLAQAQKRLAVLESLKTLQEVAVDHFGPLEDPA